MGLISLPQNSTRISLLETAPLLPVWQCVMVQRWCVYTPRTYCMIHSPAPTPSSAYWGGCILYGGDVLQHAWVLEVSLTLVRNVKAVGDGAHWLGYLLEGGHRAAFPPHRRAAWDLIILQDRAACFCLYKMHMCTNMNTLFTSVASTYPHHKTNLKPATATR